MRGSATGSDGIGRDEQVSFWSRISNRTFHPDDTLAFLEIFEKGAEYELQKTYQSTQLNMVDITAPKPNVGIVFLPGADKPTVTRLEEFNMSQRSPAQRNPTWCVNTTGSLLSTWTVDKDLSFITTDLTRQVLDNMNKFNATADKVTVHSEKVKVVDQLRDDQGRLQHDLNATMIEVDASSLIKLITQFRYLLKQSTPSMMPAHHINHLEDMMEAARVFYSRCPILFRMGTRKHIITGIDIRYGIDDESGFKTLYPSQGIQQILSVSAAFFNALNLGSLFKDKAHATVRPRFLQILVLLLSMLGEADTCQMSDFIDDTFKIKPDRADLELLFLKAIPLSSINPKVFLSSLIPAVFGHPMPGSVDGSKCWEYLLQELAKKGYLLPATFDELGHETQTWIPRWPKEGHRSSRVFGNLQLHGTESGGFNEIIPIQVEADAETPELTIYLANMTEPYMIDSVDYENVVNLQPGSYYLREGNHNGRSVTLEIRVQTLTKSINEAVQLANRAISLNNAYARDLPQFSGKLTRLMSVGNPQTAKVVASELPKFPDITRHEVWFEENSLYLVVAWKYDGRTISQGDMLARMSRAGNRVGAVVNAFVRNNSAQIAANEQGYARLMHSPRHCRTREKHKQRRA